MRLTVKELIARLQEQDHPNIPSQLTNVIAVEREGMKVNLVLDSDQAIPVEAYQSEDGDWIATRLDTGVRARFSFSLPEDAIVRLLVEQGVIKVTKVRHDD